jgi:hypothetical protein
MGSQGFCRWTEVQLPLLKQEAPTLASQDVNVIEPFHTNRRSLTLFGMTPFSSFAA